MRKIFGYLLTLSLCLTTARSALAQNQKSLKESFADLKKALHPDKAFIMPFSDTTNEDLQAFLFAVQSEKSVNGAKLKMNNGKAVITVDTKTSMTTVWDNLDKEYRNRYSITDHTPDGFILADSYQTNTASNKTGTQPKTASQKQNSTQPKQNSNSKAKNH